MTKEEFWSTIETARQAVPDGSQSMMAEQIYRELLQKPPEDILDWNLYFYEYRDAACRNDLQAASTALGVPATSDGFLDFRTWLVAQGKEIYLAAIDNPDTLAKDPHIGAEMSFPSFADCAVDAYAEKLSLADEEERRRLYNALNHHTGGRAPAPDGRAPDTGHTGAALPPGRDSGSWLPRWPARWPRQRLWPHSSWPGRCHGAGRDPRTPPPASPAERRCPGTLHWHKSCSDRCAESPAPPHHTQYICSIISIV